MDFPTRDRSILYVFLTNCPSYDYICQPLPGISDHEIVLVKPGVDIKFHKPTTRKIYLWHKADFESIRSSATEAADNLLSNYDMNIPIEILYNMFGTSTIQNVYQASESTMGQYQN